MVLIRKKKDGAVSKRREESRYIRMVKAIFKVCQRQAVPRYSSKYSRKDYHPLAAHRPDRPHAAHQEVIP
jgi:hypothetical protein